MSRLMPEGLDAFPASLLQVAVAGEATLTKLELGRSHSGISISEGPDSSALLDRVRSTQTDKLLWLQIGHAGDGDIKGKAGQNFWDGLAGLTFGRVKSAIGGPDVRSGPVLQDLVIQGICCGEIALNVENVVFRNVTAARMRLVAMPGSSVRFENCTIARLEVVVDAGADFSFKGGSILCLTFPDDIRARSIDFSGTEISMRPQRRPSAWFRKEQPTDQEIPSWIFFDAVTFRRLHKWAQEKEDAKLAHQMRGHQLAVDYYQADRSERFFLWLWWFCGNYGLSLWRPLICLLASVLAFATLLYGCGTVATDAVLPVANAVAPAADLANAAPPNADGSTTAQSSLGWRSILIGDGQGARLSRAIVGATEAIFSPVNVFSIRKLVLPVEPWVAVVQFLYSYLCLGLIFLFGFSVRRRFKI